MQDHFYLNGKKACRFDSTNKTVEIVFKGFKAIIKFNADGTTTATNYDSDGNPQIITI
ncbi:MAG: hypothetical protein LBC86_03650 [Oscillospiraceae bacterium]|jgi:hypothetical protein|nr:hypothetical protein [Oscillospiraceae bacterium]